MGGIMRYSVDLLRDLTNYEPSPRIPKRVQQLPIRTKKILAAGIFTASMGVAGLVYSLTPDKAPQIEMRYQE